ncbi:TetR/AcrR family transcriptional regulator (plasmid) [Azospirillum humicireducens]|uniref:TetR/AcrR family transcriptional regulator n=1 Tax=Azospirillum humicireducens TaxID=1226968 RepID=A0A2R4VV80_9PROT|nr:TetR/AcrR family transcriptional regulator [Azospirillum humicireducens]AWB08322.1 TetR/AcrR family transcriptional regulator [Azospirillum humicireducens]
MKVSSSTKPRIGRPSKEDAAETSNRIIDTAAQLFAAQGFAATSIEQIASACNAGKDTIYRRFPSKTALFVAVVERLRTRTLNSLEAELDSAGGHGDALARLKRVARWFLTVNLDPDMVALNRIALSEASLFGQDQRDPWEEDPIMERLIQLIRAAQEAGMLTGGDPRMIASHMLHSIVFGPSNDAMLGRKTYAAKAAQDRFFEQAWTLFLNGTSGV